MNRVLCFALLLCLLDCSFGHALSHRHPRQHFSAVTTALNAKAAMSFRYKAKISALKSQLKEKIPGYRFGSFYGATPEDTLWAKTTTQDPSQMAEIYAENRVKTGSAQLQPQVAFQIENGAIVFASAASHLSHYKADPQQPSVIRMAATDMGPRVAASTVLTDAGLALQAESGCTACHSS